MAFLLGMVIAVVLIALVMIALSNDCLKECYCDNCGTNYQGVKVCPECKVNTVPAPECEKCGAVCFPYNPSKTKICGTCGAEMTPPCRRAS